MLADPGTASVIAPAMLATAPGPFGDIVTTLDGRGVGVQSLTNGIIDTTTAHVVWTLPQYTPSGVGVVPVKA